MEGVRRAFVLATARGAGAVVAGLPLAVRAVLAAHGARFDEVGLVAPDRPRWAAEPLARREVPVRWIEAPLGETPQLPDLQDGGLTLVLAGDVLVDAAAVGALRDAPPGPVLTSDGRLVGLVCAAAEASACLARPHLWTGSPASGTRLATGLAVSLETAGSTARLEQALLDHLAGQATSDSYLAALIDRPLSRPLTRLLLRTPLAPSHVTLLGVATGLLGAAGLATVSYWGRLGGVLLLVASLVLDCVDGDLARARLAQNPAGARLDVVGDYLVNLAVFAGLAIGLLREGLTTGDRLGGDRPGHGRRRGDGGSPRAVHSPRAPPGRRPALGRRRAEPPWQARGVGPGEGREPRLHVSAAGARGRRPPGMVPLRGRRAAPGRSPAALVGYRWLALPGRRREGRPR